MASKRENRTLQATGTFATSQVTPESVMVVTWTPSEHAGLPATLPAAVTPKAVT